MANKLLLRSFAGGEITPELAGRLDLTKFQTGLSLCRNMLVLPHGPVARRPGFAFTNEARDSTRKVRLIPFSFSATQTAVLEFGHLYVRFHINGGTLIEPTKVVVSVVAGVVTVTAHGYATGDWVFIGARYHKAVVTGVDTFTTTDFAGVATVASGATAARVYTVTTPYDQNDLFAINYAQNNDIVTLTHPTYPSKELKRLGATNWTLTDVVFSAPLTPPTGVSCVATSPETSIAFETYAYVVTAVMADGVSESLASAQVTANNALSGAGNFNTISWSAVAGASRYNVYKRRGGTFGYIGQTPTLSVTDDNILADTTQSPPEDIIDLNGAPGDYPAATTYHEQRRWFGGTVNKPQVVWATRTGTESNLTSSIPARDADGLEFRLASAQNNQIRHLVPLSDLIAMTAGGEFRIFSDNAPAITPTSLTVKVQGYSGANGVQPAVTSGSVLYVQAQGSRIRELAYGGESSNYGYKSTDVSIMAPHRFNGRTITQLAYTRAPEQILWAVRDDGVLLGMTYVPDQQVYAWHAHDTDGLFESVAVVAEGNEDVVYVVVKRTVDGRGVRYIERLNTRIFTQLQDAFFVDSGLTYSGAPVTSISGLWHLEGEEVDILTDGSVHPRKTVTGGSIPLDYAASVVHVGLPMVSDIRTLPLAIEGSRTIGAAGQGLVKNVNKVHLRVSQSSVVKAGPRFDKLREYPARLVEDPYGSPPALRDGELAITVDPSWNTDASICVRQDLPLPLTVLAMTLEVQVGG